MLPDKVLVSTETYGCFIDFVTHSSANGDVNSLKTAQFARYTLSEQSSLIQSRARETGTQSFISLGVNFLFGYRQPPRRRVANPGCWREGWLSYLWLGTTNYSSSFWESGMRAVGLTQTCSHPSTGEGGPPGDMHGLTPSLLPLLEAPRQAAAEGPVADTLPFADGGWPPWGQRADAHATRWEKHGSATQPQQPGEALTAPQGRSLPAFRAAAYTRGAQPGPQPGHPPQTRPGQGEEGRPRPGSARPAETREEGAAPFDSTGGRRGRRRAAPPPPAGEPLARERGLLRLPCMTSPRSVRPLRPIGGALSVGALRGAARASQREAYAEAARRRPALPGAAHGGREGEGPAGT